MHPSYLLSLLAALPAATAIQTITTKGSKFFTADGNQWFVKGVAYQLLPQDPLIDTAQCQLDASLMKTLGANAIRSYRVQGNADHSGCMKAFADAGIYLFVDLDNPTINTAIGQDIPVWSDAMQSSYQEVMDEFIKYDNTAGFFIGNEVVNTPGSQTQAMMYVKAATRDLKKYRDSKGYRQAPIGYSAADIATIRPMLQNYLVCGDTADSIEFFGLNAYEWCGPQTFLSSGYQNLNDLAQGYPVPIFFSETGCNKPEPRTFDDQAFIFSANMSDTWSGAIVYEWLQEENNYGLIAYGNPSAAAGAFVRAGTPTPVVPDFTNLASQWAAATPSSVSSAAYSPSLSPPPCPASTAGSWEVDPNGSLPLVQAAGANTIVSAAATGAAAAPAAATTASGGTAAAATTTSGSSGGSSTPAGSSGTNEGGSSTHAGSSAATSASAAAASTAAAGTGAASCAREIAGMSVALVSVMMVFVWWL